MSWSTFRCCQKLLNGAIPVPGPTISIGLVLSSGIRNEGALKYAKHMLSNIYVSEIDLNTIIYLI